LEASDEVTRASSISILHPDCEVRSFRALDFGGLGKPGEPGEWRPTNELNKASKHVGGGGGATPPKATQRGTKPYKAAQHPRPAPGTAQGRHPALCCAWRSVPWTGTVQEQPVPPVGPDLSPASKDPHHRPRPTNTTTTPPTTSTASGFWLLLLTAANRSALLVR
jgi:hypothetical protein